jgi:hypothetical protein
VSRSPRRQRFEEEGFPPRSFPTNVNPVCFVKTYYEFFRRWLPPESGKHPSQYSPEEFTELCRGKPIELKTITQFLAVVGDTGFIDKMTGDFFSSRSQGSKRRQLTASQRKRTAKGRFRRKTKRYVRKVPFNWERKHYPPQQWGRTSIHDIDRLQLFRRLCMIKAAWIILRGEWEHREENDYGMPIEEFLPKTYKYLEGILEYKWEGKENLLSLIRKRRFSVDEMSSRSLSLCLYRNGITGKNGKRLTVGTIKTELSPSGFAKASPPANLTRLEADDIPPELRALEFYPPREEKGKLSPSDRTKNTFKSR